MKIYVKASASTWTKIYDEIKDVLYPYRKKYSGMDFTCDLSMYEVDNKYQGRIDIDYTGNNYSRPATKFKTSDFTWDCSKDYESNKSDVIRVIEELMQSSKFKKKIESIKSKWEQGYDDPYADEEYDDTWEVGNIQVHSKGDQVYADSVEDACQFVWDECGGDIDAIIRDIDAGIGNGDLIEPLLSIGYPDAFDKFRSWLSDNHPESLEEWDASFRS